MFAKKASTTLLVVALLAGLSACGSDNGDKAPTSADGSSKVRLGLTGGTAASISIDLASQEGIFKANGVDLENINVQASSLLPTYSSGDVDVVFMAPQLFATSRQTGSDITYICGLIPTDWSELVTNADSTLPVANGNGKATLEALRGKAIGVGSLGGGQESAVRTAFKASGVDLGKTTFVAVGVGPTAYAALKSDQVAAVVGSPLSMTASIASGDFKSIYKIAADSPEPLRSGFYAGFAASEKWVKNNEKAAAGFCNSVKEGLAFATSPTNKAAVTTYLDKTFSIKDPAAVEAITSPTGPVAFMSIDMSCATLQPTIDFLTEQGVIQKSPTLDCTAQNLVNLTAS